MTIGSGGSHTGKMLSGCLSCLRPGRGPRRLGSHTHSNLADEYGALDASGEKLKVPTFVLESGLEMQEVEVCYKTWGELNAAGDNAVFVAHALTGNASLDSWWAPLFGEGKGFDTSKHFIVCANILGSCYGTTGPTSTMPTSADSPRRFGNGRRRYGASFPYVTIRDAVRLHKQLLDALKVTSLAAIIGGSMGGMQALEWLIMYPELIQRAVVIACGAAQSAWQIGIGDVQRKAIFRDPKWRGGAYDATAPPTEGLKTARELAMISYRSHTAYHQKFGRSVQYLLPPTAREAPHDASSPPYFAVESYLEHQGLKFHQRFDANSYVTLTRMIDSHDVGRGRGADGRNAPVEQVLGTVRQPVLVIGIESDVLYPVVEQRELASAMPHAALHVLASDEGHDGFLLEYDAINTLVTDFLLKAPRQLKGEIEHERCLTGLDPYGSPKHESSWGKVATKYWGAQAFRAAGEDRRGATAHDAKAA